MTVIERAIESAKNRKYKLEKDLSHNISDLHRKKASGQKEVMQVTIEALEKQVAKKPRADNEDWLCCRNCGETFSLINGLNKRNRYCGNCGTKIDWSEEGGLNGNKRT
jgi:frataxin-like iron-binding protein CyaY